MLPKHQLPRSTFKIKLRSSRRKDFASSVKKAIMKRDQTSITMRRRKRKASRLSKSSARMSRPALVR